MAQASHSGEPEQQADYSAFEGTRPVNERQRIDGARALEGRVIRLLFRLAAE